MVVPIARCTKGQDFENRATIVLVAAILVWKFLGWSVPKCGRTRIDKRAE